MLKLEFIQNNISTFYEFASVNDALTYIEKLTLTDNKDVFKIDAVEKLKGFSGDKDMAKQLATLLFDNIASKLKNEVPLDKAVFDKMKIK